MNQCHDIKQEYENLQAKKREFVLACAQVGHFDFLSKQRLNDLKFRKLDLEQARDALEYKLENDAVRSWKKVWNEATSAQIDLRFPKAVTLGEYIATSDFQDNLAAKILVNVLSGQIERGHTWDAVTAFAAVIGLGYLPEGNKKKILEQMQQEDFQSHLTEDLLFKVQNCQRHGHDEWNVVVFLNDIQYLGFLTDEIRTRVREHIDRDEFKKDFIRYIESNGQNLGYTTTSAWITVVGFRAALGLGLLRKDEIERIQKLTEQQKFQVRLNEAIFSDSQDPESVLDASRSLFAVKELIEFSRKRRRK